MKVSLRTPTNKNIDDLSYENIERKSSMIVIKKNNVWSNSSSFSSSPKKEENVLEKHLNDSHIDRNLESFRQYVDDEEYFTEDEIIPQKIEGLYIYDYNIFYIDEIIKKKFEQDKKNNLIILGNKLKIEQNKIQERQTMIERKNSKEKIEKYKEEIQKYQDNTDLKKYIEKSQPILEEYRKIGPISTVISFTKNKQNKKTEPETIDDQKIRHNIISKYLECARKFIVINLVRQLPSIDTCMGCNTKYDDMEVDDDSGSLVCPVCGLEKINIVKNPLFSDGSRINNSKNNYEDRVNFEKVLLRYQGKQITKPGKDLYEKLDKYFKSIELPSSEEYKAMPLLSNGTKEGTSRELMFDALANIGCPGYYDDINLICNVFFGWSLDDISHLEEAIMKDYDMFQEVYESLPDKEGRKSSLNSQWKLYILLKRRGWPCKSLDFKIPTTPNILEYHKLITKQVYGKLGWKYK